jgi:hypothetical protein
VCGWGDPARCAGLAWFCPFEVHTDDINQTVLSLPIHGGRKKQTHRQRGRFFFVSMSRNCGVRVSTAVADDRNIFRADPAFAGRGRRPRIRGTWAQGSQS